MNFKEKHTKIIQELKCAIEDADINNNYDYLINTIRHILQVNKFIKDNLEFIKGYKRDIKQVIAEYSVLLHIIDIYLKDEKYN